ncbi:MAG: hypothetical protein AAB588_02440 [Patescibacteria group bacterium]
MVEATQQHDVLQLEPGMEPCGHSFKDEAGLLLSVRKFLTANTAQPLFVVRVRREGTKRYALSAPIRVTFNRELDSLQVPDGKNRIALARGLSTAEDFELTTESYIRIGAQTGKDADMWRDVASSQASAARDVLSQIPAVAHPATRDIVPEAVVIPPPTGLCGPCGGQDWQCSSGGPRQNVDALGEDLEDFYHGSDDDRDRDRDDDCDDNRDGSELD